MPPEPVYGPLIPFVTRPSSSRCSLGTPLSRAAGQPVAAGMVKNKNHGRLVNPSSRTCTLTETLGGRDRACPAVAGEAGSGRPGDQGSRHALPGGLDQARPRREAFTCCGWFAPPAETPPL